MVEKKLLGGRNSLEGKYLILLVQIFFFFFVNLVYGMG